MKTNNMFHKVVILGCSYCLVSLLVTPKMKDHP